MGKIAFKDSKTTKKKNLILTHTYEDITINLPGKDGELISDLTIDRHIQNIEVGTDVNKILKPDIRENNGGIVDEESWSRPLQIASYKTSLYFVGKHTGTEWEAYADRGMKGNLDSTTDKEFKNAWLPDVNEDGKEVYVRYRFRSGDIVSPWSDLLYYRTPAYGIRKIKVTVSDDSLTPTITASEFRSFGEDKIGKIEYVSTDWRIKDSAGLTVFESLNNTVNRNSITLKEGILNINSRYTVEVVYNSNNIKFPSSKPGKLTWETVNIYIVKPELTYLFEGGKHYIVGTPYNIVNSNEYHRGTSWRIVAISDVFGTVERYNVNRGSNNLTKIDITPYILATGMPHIIECVYYSEKYESRKAKIRIVPKKSAMAPTVFSYEESVNKYGNIKFSTFDVVDKIDKVKGIVYRVYDNNYNVERDNEMDHSNDGKYREPLNIVVPYPQILKWLDGQNTYYSRESSKDRSFTVSAYIVGEKYNTEIFTTTYKPTIEITGLASVNARDVNNTTFYINNYSSNITWGRCSGVTYNVYKKSDNSLLLSKTINGNQEVTYTTVTADNFEYNIDYVLEATLHTNIGKVVLPKKDFYVPLGFIAAPEPELEITPVNDNVVKLRIKRGTYTYTPGDRTGKANKECIFKIYNNETHELLDTITLTNPDPVDGKDDTDETWHTIEKSYRRESKILYNTKYRLESEYTSVNGVRSPIAVKNFEIGNRPDVIISKPELKVEADNEKKLIKATIINTFTVSGLEDTSHVSTSWVLKYGNSIIWGSIDDTTDLLTKTIQLDEILYDKDYTLEVTWKAANGQSSAIGYAREFMLPFGNLKYFNIRLKYRVGVGRIGTETWHDNDIGDFEMPVYGAYYDIIIYKWPPELEIISTRALWFRNSDIRFYTGTNSNVIDLVNNVKKYAEPYANILNSEGYTGPDAIPAFRIGTTRYSQISDSGATIWVTFRNKKTGKTNEIAFGDHKSWKIGYGHWVEARMRYNWIKDTNAVVSA